MKAFSILKDIIKIIQEKLKISVYNTFPEKTVGPLIDENFLTIEINSGSEDETTLMITVYTPEKYGAKNCRNLMEKTVGVLQNSALDDLRKNMQVKNLKFNKKINAYIIQCEVKFKLIKDNKTLILFGQEKILANPDLALNYARNINVYYSPISGAHYNDLGNILKKVNGSAVVDANQFKRLADIITKGKQDILKFGEKDEDPKFKAALISLEKKPKNEIYFSFIEVPNEN